MWSYGNYADAGKALAFEMRFARPKVDPANILVALKPATHEGGWAGNYRPLIALPLEISGLATDQTLWTECFDLRIDFPDGTHATPQGSLTDSLYRGADGYYQAVSIDSATARKAGNSPVRLRVTLYLVLLGNPATRVVRPGAGAVDVPGVGRCSSGYLRNGTGVVNCATPLRGARSFLWLNLRPGFQNRFFVDTSFSPLPADASISPIRWFGTVYQGRPEAPLISWEPLAIFRRDIDASGVVLTNYITKAAKAP
jgi:hypothetical protein